jgi:hypothetical protein
VIALKCFYADIDFCREHFELIANCGEIFCYSRGAVAALHNNQSEDAIIMSLLCEHMLSKSNNPLEPWGKLKILGQKLRLLLSTIRDQLQLSMVCMQSLLWNECFKKLSF